MDKNAQGRQQIDKVLVIDDDDNWCYLSKILLEKSGVGKQILTATNGLEALKQLQRIAATGGQMPELIFLDIKMPVMDGFEFLEELKHLPELDFSQSRIYMSTSSFLTKDKERANQYSVAGFITKPLTQAVLRDILH